MVSNRRMGSRLVIAAILVLHSAAFPAQEQALTVSSAAPQGELAQLDDAYEIRVTFSQPMVALGTPEVAVPAWVTIEPAIPLVASWSGTRTLILTPDPDVPLRFGSTYRVRIGAGARSLGGQSVNRPFEFTFTTPTARLLGADWYRDEGQVTRPVFVRLRFNQPMEPTAVLRHLRVAHERHELELYAMASDERAHWEREDPANLARFDARVADIRAVIESRAEVAVTLPSEWDRRRFPETETSVVLQTAEPPAPGSWLRLSLDGGLTGREGTTPHPPQSSVIQLEVPFMPRHPQCVRDCDPEGTWALGPTFTRGVHLEDLQKHLIVADLVDGREQLLKSSGIPAEAYRPTEGHQGLDLSQLGYAPPSPASTRVYELSDAMTSADGQRLGFTWRQTVRLRHARPYAVLEGGVWESAGGPAIPLLTRNTLRVAEYLQPLLVTDINSMLFRPPTRRDDLLELPSGAPRMVTLPSQANRHEAHPFDLTPALNSSGTGLAWVAVRPDTFLPGSGGRDESNWHGPSLVQVTNLALSVKDSPTATLVWVTTLDGAMPVADARVVIRNPRNEVLWTGTTGADGVAMAPALPLRSPQRPWDLSFVVTAEKHNDVTWVASNWMTSGSPMNYYAAPGAGPTMRGSTFTDRGVYALGDEVRIKAILREEVTDGVTPIKSGRSLTALIRNGQRQEIARTTLAVSEWSSVEWVWRIPVAGGLGTYSIEIFEPSPTPSAPVTASFLVAAFRRPDFSVDVALDATAPVQGAAIEGRIDAKFLFGAALGPQPVRWTLTKNTAHNVPAAIRARFPTDRYAFGYEPRYDTRSRWEHAASTESTTLPSSGPLRITHTTTAATDHATSFQLEASVEGVSGQFIANRASVVMHPASIYVGIVKPPYLADATRPMNVELFATGLDGTSRTNVPVTVSLLREVWTTERTEVGVGSWRVTTTTGMASLPVTIPQDGAYVLRAIAEDEAGRKTRTDVSFYAYGKGRGAWRVDGNRIAVIPEKDTWEPGTQARLLVQTPWERATALVTIERDGIRRYERREITATNNTILVPVTPADLPNVFVSVLLLKGRTTVNGQPHEDLGRPDYRLGYAELKVDDSSKRLAVAVQADRAAYQPRDTVQVDVQIADHRGLPRRGEVTLWAMDEGLLSLTGYTLPDVARAIYAHRPLRVQTLDTRTHLIERRTLIPSGRAGQTAGGGGGGRGGSAGVAIGGVPAPVPAPPPVFAGRMMTESVEVAAASGLVNTRSPDQDVPMLRDNFGPLATWVGSLVTGEDGRARTTATLPDSLTRYRIMAVAGDLASDFGVGESSIQTSLPLTLLPALPRFLMVGNRASFGAVVTNNSSAGGQVRVDVAVLDGSPVTFEGATSHTLTLAPGESAPIRFDARAHAIGQARVRVTARLGSHADAFEVPFPVMAPAPLTTVAAYGDTTATATESVRVPANVAPGVGGLTITLASTALAGLSDSVRFLRDYPYDCAEPLASRALAQLLMADLQTAFGAAESSRDTLRAEATATLNSLSRFRCPDGGYGPFASSCQSSPYLTAYIVHILRTAETLQVPIDRQAINNAMSYLERQLRPRPTSVQAWPAWAATQAYMLKVLIESGRRQPQPLNELLGALDRMPVYALSYVADALRASGETGPRYADVIRRLTNRLRVDADRAFVEELDEAGLLWLWHSNVRATAVVLEGLVRRGDRSDLIAPMARWLTAERSEDRWRTTQEHGVALLAMVTYYRVMEPEVPRMTVATRLGATTIGTATFEGRSTVSQQVVVPTADLPKGMASDLSVNRTGTGRVYYTARLQYQSTDVHAAMTRGLRLSREYSKLDPGTVGDGTTSTTFTRGDIVRVTVTIWVPHEGRFLAITDPVPAGLEPIDGALNTTARDVAQAATRQSSDGSWLEWWRRGGFQHVEKHDDRVIAFATRLAPGRHTFSYLARAMTAGTFETAGTWGEAMYAPEITGRAAAQTVVVR